MIENKLNCNNFDIYDLERMLENVISNKDLDHKSKTNIIRGLQNLIADSYLENYLCVYYIQDQFEIPINFVEETK